MKKILTFLIASVIFHGMSQTLTITADALNEYFNANSNDEMIVTSQSGVPPYNYWDMSSVLWFSGSSSPDVGYYDGNNTYETASEVFPADVYQLQFFNSSDSWNGSIAGANTQSFDATGTNIVLQSYTMGGGFSISSLPSSSETGGTNTVIISSGNSNVSSELSQQDETTPFASGFGIGLLFYGFGWKMRIISRINDCRSGE